MKFRLDRSREERTVKRPSDTNQLKRSVDSPGLDCGRASVSRCPDAILAGFFLCRPAKLRHKNLKSI